MPVAGAFSNFSGRFRQTSPEGRDDARRTSSPRRGRWRRIHAGVSKTRAGRATVVTGVTHDSRAVSRGSVFVAIRGPAHRRRDVRGRRGERGAPGDRVGGERAADGLNLPWLRTTDCPAGPGRTVATSYGRPSELLTLVVA